jgi:two-component system, NtrC family, response regulator
MPHLLIIEDEPSLRDLYRRLLVQEGYSTSSVTNLTDAKTRLATETFDLIMSDVRLPDGRSVDHVATWYKQNPDRPIVLLTAFGNIPDCAKALKAGAYDYLVKGDDDNRILPTLAAALASAKSAATTRTDVQANTLDQLLILTPNLGPILSQLSKIAPTDLAVLLLGDSGVGKEVLAQAIHHSSKQKGDMVSLNCAALTPELLESELFGHVKGAFSGAVADKKGLVSMAEGGTLFLDELAELPLPLQAKLLRLLEDGSYYRVGDPKPYRATFRLLAATNQSIPDQISKGLFREDLYYRVNDFEVQIPPLRDRPQDLLNLSQLFVDQTCKETHKKVDGLRPDAQALLVGYHWPGNIRQLRKVIRRAVILAEGTQIEPHDLPAELHDAGPITGSTINTWSLEAMEQQQIQRALAHTAGNKQAAADLLGIGIATLYRKLKEV